ncbi:hypothetical protein ZIOFF_002445 [Zingiber officinale]|uniref:TH1 domain-containing protein n=1 Tax=Zingiber officinale TaxID=94328 RepID=A0A8J5HWB0_ZINOF|nr:hypothetical protein ZIOFF_002445 [Zingiber officinale]
MAKSRSKKKRRLRTLRREIMEPFYDRKDVAKLAAQEAVLAAPKLAVITPASIDEELAAVTSAAMGDRTVLFADKVIKVTGSGKMKKQIMLITDFAIYLVDSDADALKRRIALAAVEKICSSKFSDNFFALIIPTEYDCLMASTRKTEIVNVLIEATKGATEELEVVFSNRSLTNKVTPFNHVLTEALCIHILFSTDLLTSLIMFIWSHPNIAFGLSPVEPLEQGSQGRLSNDAILLWLLLKSTLCRVDDIGNRCCMLLFGIISTISQLQRSVRGRRLGWRSHGRGSQEQAHVYLAPRCYGSREPCFEIKKWKQKTAKRMHVPFAWTISERDFDADMMLCGHGFHYD